MAGKSKLSRRNASDYGIIDDNTQSGTLSLVKRLKKIELEKAKPKNTAVIKSVIKLSNKQVSEILIALNKIFDRKLNAKCVVDKSLVSGLHIQVEEFVIDQTSKHYIDLLSQKMEI